MRSRTKGILGIIFGVLGVLLIPIIFGPLALFFGYKARKEGSAKAGLAGIILGVTSLVIFIVFLLVPGEKLMTKATENTFAVVSQSMEHGAGDFDDWWQKQETWYSENGVTKENFLSFPYNEGIYKGDMLIVEETTINDLKVGDVVIFKLSRPEPIVARITKKYEENGVNYVSTKGDMNPTAIKSPSLDETKITEEQIIGKVMTKAPKLGWVKIFLMGIGFSI